MHASLSSIPEELISIFANHTNQLSAIYNYTRMIPDLRLLLEQIRNQSTGVNQQGKTEQETNTTQNCTEQQSKQQANQDALVVMKDTPVLKNCKELHDAGYTVSGSYRLDPSEGNALSRFRAYCDQDTAGGGWTVWMRRFDGFLSFDRDWEAYFNGFGDLSGEFWLGLRKMRQAQADQTFRIRFDLEAPDGSTAYAEYTNCSMEDWSKKFKLTVGPFVGGAAGDSFSYHNNMKFTTSDKDNDKNSVDNCAQLADGGWWFNDCQKACLTGSYENGTHSQAGIVGIQWFSWKGANYSLSRVEMKAKPT
ncbi:microfibril-associated glycoprotein 4-like [Oculina patagonica]